MNDSRIAVLFVAVIVVLFLFPLPSAIYKSSQTIQEAEEFVLDDEWVTYINGVVVDGKGVTVSNYDVEIDYNNKIVKLTTKQPRTTYVPITIPIPVK